MRDLWLGLPVLAQDMLLLLALLLPLGLIGLAVLRGFAPAPLVRAMLWRFRWANALFVLLIAVSVGLGIGLLAQERGLRAGTAQAADKFDMIVSAPGSEITMMMAAVYLQPTSVPLVPGDTYAEIADHPSVRIAAPLAFGDSHDGAPIVGTTAPFVAHLSDGALDGRAFGAEGEAVIGARVPLALGARLEPAHGTGDAAEHGAHEGTEFTVVGRMAPLGNPWDNAILVPVESVWATHGLASGHAPDSPTQLGPPFDARYFPGTPAIVVKADSLAATYGLRSQFDQRADTMAFFPGTVLTRLYTVMGDVRQAMSVMAVVTQGLVALSVMVGLMILTRLFRRNMALLRALGAPGRFVFATVWSYAATLLVSGAVLGLAVGQAATLVLSRVVSARTDIAIAAPLGWPEIHAAAGFTSLAAALALLPALTVLRQPIIAGLRA
ncbi:FtsX-like permease family protein [Tranquillimonas rosea]|uniref:FtsX-like permease family protein n=1 Tax=Tranquillimonas rosea TaxID=641238 RepID=UPI003BABD354